VLRRFAGHANVHRPQVSAVLDAPLPHAPGRREFARARLRWHEDAYRATPTGAQTSHRLHSLAGADALLVAHEEHGDYSAGARLPALLLAT
jgi:molybdopterin biosynthesis enzyme